MTENTTLRQLSGMADQPAAMAESALIMIDCQNTYTQGVLELDGVQAALEQAAVLLDRARSARIPIFHVMHDAGPGSPYDVRAPIGRIVDLVAPPRRGTGHRQDLPERLHRHRSGRTAERCRAT
jgi:nicotinamidase-related amidase